MLTQADAIAHSSLNHYMYACANCLSTAGKSCFWERRMNPVLVLATHDKQIKWTSKSGKPKTKEVLELRLNKIVKEVRVNIT